MKADLVGLCRRCRSLPRSAWCDSCPLELVAIERASRIFGQSLADPGIWTQSITPKRRGVVRQ
jgi:hypothetical protein